MNSWQLVHIFAGIFIVVSLLLGAPASPWFINQWWLAVTAFVGLNIFQSGFTKWCLLEKLMYKLGAHRN